MKKMIWALPLALVLALSGCVGPRGDVYISFNWDYQPWYFSANDRNLPDVIVQLTEYRTEPGDYRCEYITNVSGTDYAWTVYYDLTAKPGYFPMVPGEDSRFQLFLYGRHSPVLLQLQEIAPLGEASQDQQEGSGSIRNEDGGSLSDQSRAWKQLYEYEQSNGLYTLHVRAGIWEPAE